MQSKSRWMLYAAAIAGALGVMGWSMLRHRAPAGADMLVPEDKTVGHGASGDTEEDVARSISEDVEPTLLDAPFSVARFVETPRPTR
jgi:hypothetical protein